MQTMLNTESKRENTKLNKSEGGYTLLEYSAGAAIIAGILWVALNGLGNNLSSLLASVGSWAQKRADSVAKD